MDRTLSKLLTIDRAKWYKPWTWGTTIKGAWYRPNARGAGERVTSTVGNIKIDAQFMKGLRNIGGKEAGRDVAVLIAQYATLQQQTLVKEQQILGLHTGVDLNAVPSSVTDPDVAGNYAKVDINNPLAHFGISNEDLREIGLDPTDIQEVGKAVEKLTKQGLGSIDDVQQVMTSINDVAKIVLKSELVHESTLVYEQNLARVQGADLLSDILTDAEMSYRRGEAILGADRPRQMISKTDPYVVGYFSKRNEALETALGAKGMASMKVESDRYRAIVLDVAEIYNTHMEIDDQIKQRREVLARAGEALGITIDANDPRGLRTAEQILIALDADHEARTATDPIVKARAGDRRDAALENLRGLDVDTMKRSPFAKLRSAFGSGDTPDIPSLQRFRDIAEHIVYIRKDAPLGKALLEEHIEQLGEGLEQIVELRRQANPEAMAHVTSMIRAAVLTEWQNAGRDLNVDPKTGQVTEGFDPSSKTTRGNVEALLTQWGLKVDHFGPEIDSVLFSRMTADDIALWRKETQFSDAMIDRIKHDERPVLNLDRTIGRRVMDTATKDAMLSMLEAFQEGDKLDLKAGQRITIDTGKIPVEPTGLAGVRAKLAGAHIGQFEVELGSDGYKIHFRTGGELKGSFDGVVGKKFGDHQGLGKNLEARLEASMGLEGSGSHLTGMTISFDKGVAGREALVSLVAKMIDGDKITVKDWQSASDVGFTYEDRAKGSIGIKGEGRLAVGGKIKDSDLGDNRGTTLDDDFMGVGIVGGLNASYAIGGKWVGIDSLNQTTRKGETEMSITMGVSGGVYARFYNLMNMGTGHLTGATGGQEGANQRFGLNDEGKPNYNISENVGHYDLINMGGSVSTTAVRKWKHVQTPDGQYVKGTEKVRQSNSKSGPIAAFAACLNTPGMLAMTESQDPKYVGITESLQQFMKLMGPSDHIAVTYAPKPGVLEDANSFMAHALAARSHGDEEQARRYDNLAREIIDKDSNYYPTKIGLITTDTQKREDTVISGRWIKWDTFSDGKSEHQGLVMTFPA